MIARRVGATIAIASVCAALLAAPISASASATGPEAQNAYPGDPVAEARLVALENQRLVDVQSLIKTATRENLSANRPYRLATGTLPTLVLTERGSAYTLDELARIAPRSVSVDADGAYVVSEHIVIAEGAQLNVRSNQGVVLRLASGPDFFVSIVAIGGSLVVQGEGEYPVSVTSWDVVAGKPDIRTADGRAYVRILGGQAALSQSVFSDLGFWSGVTGGVSFTGGDPTVDMPDQVAGDIVPEATASNLKGELLPADGGLPTLSLDPELDTLGFSSALVQAVTFSRNAFGLFVTNSDHAEIRGSTIEDSLVDGLIFHRDVSNGTVVSTIARGNARDGFRITRATSSISLEQLTATGNGRNGISLEGGPLASGPSAVGIPITVYGDNRVFASSSTENGRYGIEVVGGSNITLTNNSVARNTMGIVVTQGATAVVIQDNEVEDSVKQGIAVRDSGLDLTITGNTVRGAQIGIYLRDSGGAIERNTIQHVSNHGITLVGATGASLVVENDVQGSGPSAVDVARTDGAVVRANVTDEWQSTKPLTVVLQGIFQPLTIMWLALALLLLFASIPAGRRPRGIHDPFAHRAPLSTHTRGIVPREQIQAPA